MNDFKRNDRFGGKRSGGGFGKKPFGRPSFGGKPSFQRSGGGFGGRPQGQLYPAVCAECSKPCEVPFRPDGQRPIYCRDCYGGPAAAAASAREFSAKQSFAKSAPVQAQPQKPDPRIDLIQRDLEKMNLKLDKILLEIAVTRAQAGMPPAVEAAPKKKKVAAKKK